MKESDLKAPPIGTKVKGLLNDEKHKFMTGYVTDIYKHHVIVTSDAGMRYSIQIKRFYLTCAMKDGRVAIV